MFIYRGNSVSSLTLNEYLIIHLLVSRYWLSSKIIYIVNRNKEISL